MEIDLPGGGAGGSVGGGGQGVAALGWIGFRVLG
jgi:hypothetical protein